MPAKNLNQKKEAEIVCIATMVKSYKQSSNMRWKMKTKQEITKELEQAIEDYNKEFPDVLIPKENLEWLVL